MKHNDLSTFFSNLLISINPKISETNSSNQQLFITDDNLLLNPKQPFPQLSIQQIQNSLLSEKKNTIHIPFNLKLKPAFALTLVISFIILIIGFFSLTHNIEINKIYSLSQGQEVHISKNLTGTIIKTKDAGISFQMTPQIKFLLLPESQLKIQNKSLYLISGRIMGEFFKKNDAKNLNYTIFVKNMKIQIIGTKFYIENIKNHTSTIFVEHGHLRITTQENKTFDLLSQSYAIVSNQKTMITHFSNYFKIPFNVKTNLSQKDLKNIRNFDLSKSIQNSTKKVITKTPHYSFIYLDNFENYKSNIKLSGKKWDIWYFNSIVERPTIVTERHGNQICQFKFQGTNNYSEAGIKAVAPFNKKYETNNISAIQIKIKGKLSTKNQLLVRLYKKDGNIFQHKFSSTETAHLFDDKWHKLTLPNTKSFWKFYSESTPSISMVKFDNLKNTKILLIGIINNNDKQPHTLYFDDLCFVQKQ